MRVLVVGAAGRLGRPVALRLQEAGYEVRALTRRPERCNDLRRVDIEVVTGDVARPETLPSACVGCDALYIGLRGYGDTLSEQAEVHRVEQLLQAGRTAQVKRVVYLSDACRTAGNERHAAVRVKLAASAPD